MVAKFLDHNNRELKQGDGDSNENGKKAIGLYIKKTTLHVHYVFLYTSQPSLRDCDMKFPNFTRPFMEYVNARQLLNLLFLFPNLDTVLSDLTPENFAII